MKNEDKKAVAMDLFILGWAQQLICDRLSVSKNTITKWKKDGNWEEIRNATSITPIKTVPNLHKQVYELSQKKALTREDAIILNSVNTYLDRIEKNTLGVTDKINVLQEFTEFILAKEDLEAAKALAKYQSEFLARQFAKTKDQT